jgi:hypothetical protein
MDTQRGRVRSHREAVGIGRHSDGFVRSVRFNHPGAIWQRQPIRIRTFNSGSPVQARPSLVAHRNRESYRPSNFYRTKIECRRVDSDFR